jgi:hypothetical protein
MVYEHIENIWDKPRRPSAHHPDPAGRGGWGPNSVRLQQLRQLYG